MKLLFSLFILLSSFQALAGLKMFLWEPGTTAAPLVLFAKENETPEQAAQRYLKNIVKDLGMLELFLGQAPYLPLQGFREIRSAELRDVALLMANNSYDYTTKSPRLKQFNDVFGKAQARTWILPMMPDAGLDSRSAKELRSLIANTFPMLVAMGGEDVDPSLYGKEKTLARDTIVSRDRAEIAIIKEYVKTAKGFLLGICRGHQIASVALGYKLIQDIPTLVEQSANHANDFHQVRILQTNHQFLNTISPGGKVNVFGDHHEAVIYRPGGPLQLAAVAEDGVTEALEFKNGQGLLLQFHPEAMGNSTGQGIMNRIVEVSRSRSIYSCAKAHRR